MKGSKNMKETIHLLHTNDLHSHFENWPKIRRYLVDRQTKLKQNNQEYLTLDLGDFMDRFHPLTDATNGLLNIEIMNQINYDYATIGNNEGITNSKQELNALYEDANFQVLLANLLDKDTQNLPEWAKEEAIFTTKEGTRIGIVGLTSPITLTYEPFGWNVLNPVSCLNNIIPELSKKTDIIVIMSHLGLPDDKILVENFSEIDVIIESHTHHLFEKGMMYQDCLLAAAGRFGEYIGEVILEIDNKQLVSKKATTIKTNDLEEKTRDIVEIANYKLEGETLLKNDVVGVLPQTLFKETTLMDMTLEAIKDYAGVEVSLLNTGIILTDLFEGEVTKKDLHECLPHPMNLIRVTLKGRDVKRLVYEIEKNRAFLYKFQIVGMKFRGKSFGKMCYDGLAYYKDTKEVTWCGEEIQDEKEYTLATVDHLSFLPFFPTFEIAGKIEIISSDFLRTILGSYIKKNVN